LFDEPLKGSKNRLKSLKLAWRFVLQVVTFIKILYSNELYYCTQNRTLYSIATITVRFCKIVWHLNTPWRSYLNVPYSSSKRPLFWIRNVIYYFSSETDASIKRTNFLKRTPLLSGQIPCDRWCPLMREYTWNLFGMN
jgi:hypothetical protein